MGAVAKLAAICRNDIVIAEDAIVAGEAADLQQLHLVRLRSITGLPVQGEEICRYGPGPEISCWSGLCPSGRSDRFVAPSCVALRTTHIFEEACDSSCVCSSPW